MINVFLHKCKALYIYYSDSPSYYNVASLCDSGLDSVADLFLDSRLLQHTY